MHRRSALCLVAVLLCLAGRTAAQAPRIIDNPRPTWTTAQALHLSPSPILVIGTQPGANYEFGRVIGAVRLSDGGIVVADAATMKLSFYDAKGVFLRTAGGRGEGPGEFLELETLSIVPGDTLLAGVRRQVSSFTAAGKYLQRYLVPSAGPPPTPNANGIMGPLTLMYHLAYLNGSGGRLLAAVKSSSPANGRTHWVDAYPVTIIDAKNATVAQLGTLPWMDRTVDNDGTSRSPWFGAYGIFASDGNRIYAGFGGEYAIRVYNTRGVLQHIIRRAWTPTRVTKPDIERYVVEWGKRWIRTTGAEAEKERADLRDDPYAATVPAFAAFIADRVGRLWVREARIADAPRSGSLMTTPLVPSNWSVFDGGGHWLGDVTMPANFLPKDIGADYVLGVARDADDVQTAVVYRLAVGKQ